jgi:hypothetical protein
VVNPNLAAARRRKITGSVLRYTLRGADGKPLMILHFKDGQSFVSAEVVKPRVPSLFVRGKVGNGSDAIEAPLVLIRIGL